MLWTTDLLRQMRGRHGLRVGRRGTSPTPATSTSILPHGGARPYPNQLTCKRHEAHLATAVLPPSPRSITIPTLLHQALRTVELEKGYWRYGRETNDVRECGSKRFCTGGDGSSGDDDGQQPLTLDAYCRDTYEGPLW